MTRAAREAVPREAVGVLYGENNLVRSFLRLTNISNDPDRFQFEENEFRAATSGESPMAFFHSHPTDIASPSSLDVAGASDWPRAFHLILSLRPAEILRCWRIFDAQALPEKIEILDS